MTPSDWIGIDIWAFEWFAFNWFVGFFVFELMLAAIIIYDVKTRK